ncbi:MAG: MerR family transcriptional regulator [Firmicutes bacterium]|nr:MerR family transcriptional regulator [Bacillota bacterium]
MSLYTTGELAKKCNVSVRTVQYYDQRGILVPTELSEGGRRLFSEEDVETLQTICFLRDLDIPIKVIAEILESEESKKVIELLLNEQEEDIQKELKRKSEQLDKIKGIRSALTSFKDGSQKTIHDISTIMEEKEKRRDMYKKLLVVALPIEAMEIITLVLGFVKGIWTPFLLTLIVMGISIYFLFNYWYKRIEYLCPECHTKYQPKKLEAFMANHTPRTRKLTCPTCRRKIWSLEVYRKEIQL